MMQAMTWEEGRIYDDTILAISMMRDRHMRRMRARHCAKGEVCNTAVAGDHLTTSL
jgi:hypothetical protein